MSIRDKLPVLEAILFAGGEPVDIDKICLSIELEKNEALELIDMLSEKYKNEDSGIELLKLDSSYQLAAKKEYAPYIKTALEIKKNTALSPAAMEVLAIVAYNQPITKGFVENVRGVDSSGVVNSLVEKNLLVEAGRLDLPGRPIAYKTTDNFLRSFQLTELGDLPPIPQQKEQITFDEIASDDNNN
ncbi:MAG: SMC-Scp complex subunit ScpB [Ruminococcus sp.]|nr:SMC-Scp complex subunit ScpB [Ruminococcus sp.]